MQHWKPNEDTVKRVVALRRRVSLFRRDRPRNSIFAGAGNSLGYAVIVCEAHLSAIRDTVANELP